MNMSFPALLVAATFITGIIWALDALFWAPKRRTRAAEAAVGAGGQEAAQAAAKEPAVVEVARSFFPIILAVLVVRSFVVEPFRIPSGSMMPTLLVGDFILVNKFSYGLRLPVLNTRVLDLGSPERGDIAVFRYPEDPRIDYIKRVVGVPGDHLVYQDKVLYVNGEPMAQTPVGTYVGEGSGASMSGASQRVEQLGEVNHEILVVPNAFERPFQYTVPEGHYFAMGDNRDNSRDSRFWGPVPDENLVGKAFFIWWNIDCGQRGLFACLLGAGETVNWSRIGSSIE
jgi:signal peptidase I